MDCNVKHCIINASNGAGWYPKGTERLKRSLIHHGYSGDILTWNDWPNDNFDKSCPYNIKAAAFQEAIKMGYTHILWLDCSVWAIQDPNKIFDVINEQGHYFWSSGYNCAQVCSDKCLQYFETSRDEAEKMIDCSTSMFGINLYNEDSARFIYRFMKAAKDGAFTGSREHDGQSKDARFLFHRQDQSCASIILNKLGMKIHDPGQYSSYYQKEVGESVIFLMRGM